MAQFSLSYAQGPGRKKVRNQRSGWTCGEQLPHRWGGLHQVPGGLGRTGQVEAEREAVSSGVSGGGAEC